MRSRRHCLPAIATKPAGRDAGRAPCTTAMGAPTRRRPSGKRARGLQGRRGPSRRVRGPRRHRREDDRARAPPLRRAVLRDCAGAARPAARSACASRCSHALLDAALPGPALVELRQAVSVMRPYGRKADPHYGDALALLGWALRAHGAFADAIPSIVKPSDWPSSRRHRLAGLELSWPRRLALRARTQRRSAGRHDGRPSGRPTYRCRNQHPTAVRISRLDRAPARPLAAGRRSARGVRSAARRGHARSCRSFISRRHTASCDSTRRIGRSRRRAPSRWHSGSGLRR